MSERVLIIRYSSLGDLVLTLKPAALFLKKNPDIRADFLTHENLLPIVRQCGLFNRIYTIGSKKFSQAHLRLQKKMRRTHYSCVYDLQNKIFSRFFTLFLNKTEKRFYTKRSLRDNINFGLLKRYPVKNEDWESVALRYSRVLGLNGQSVEKQLFRLKPLLQPVARDREKLILVHPHASFSQKSHFELFNHLLNLEAMRDYRIAVIGQGHFKFRPRENLLDWQNSLSLAELINVMRRASHVITTDSGPMHLAAECGAKVLAFFFQTSPGLGFGPLAENVHIHCYNLPCQPCSLHGGRKCPELHYACKGQSPFVRESQWVEEHLG